MTTQTANTPVASTATVKEVFVNWSEGKTGEIEGSYPTIEAFEADVKSSYVWLNNSGAKINITITFTDDSTYTFRYDVSNYEMEAGEELYGNGIVDLRETVRVRRDFLYTEQGESYHGSEVESMKALYNSFVDAMERTHVAVELNRTNCEELTSDGFISKAYEMAARKEYALEDMEILKENGYMAITGTINGVIHLDYDGETSEASDSMGIILIENASEDEMITWLMSQYTVEEAVTA